jgi:hypothetical protein
MNTLESPTESALQMDISPLVPAAVRSTGVDLQADDFTSSNALVGGKDDAE